MSDPRERIETANLSCSDYFDPYDLDGSRAVAWEIGGTSERGAAGYADWPEVVSFAEAILAANEAWLDANTPTLAKLRTKYPGFNFNVQSVVCGPTYCEVAWIKFFDGTNEGKHFESEEAAVRWLAAKLEELSDGE